MAGSDESTIAPAGVENDVHRLRRTVTEDGMSVGLVSAYAGDREMSEAETDIFDRLRQSRGIVFYSDLIYTITHQHFAPEIAEVLWNKVLAHKHAISERLDRNVRITVATLDFLSNIEGELVAPTVISEGHVSRIVNLSMRDGLTGLFNHSSCYELLDLELGSHRRLGGGLSVLMLDIDDFKVVNDLDGHQEGDRILVEMARILREQTRETDICCRFGGEEFVVILPLTDDRNEAPGIAERIRARAESTNPGGRRVTVSVGLASIHHETLTSHELIERADRAMYTAKMAGKNRVVGDVGRPPAPMERR